MEIIVSGRPYKPAEIDRIKKRAKEIENTRGVSARPGDLDIDVFQAFDDSDALDDAMTALLRDRSAVDTACFDIPRKPGVSGFIMYKVRAVLWKLLRYQHDRMSSRQNRINALIISTLEQRTRSLENQLEELRQAVAQHNNTDSGKQAEADRREEGS